MPKKGGKRSLSQEDCWSLWVEEKNEERDEGDQSERRRSHEHRSDHEDVGQLRGRSVEDGLHQAVLASLCQLLLLLRLIGRLRGRVVLWHLPLLLGAHLVLELSSHKLRKDALLLV